MSVGRYILLAENDPDALNATKLRLETKGFTVFPASGPDEARLILQQKRVHLAIVDIRLEDDSSGYDTSGLDLARKIDPIVARIILTGYPSYDYLREILGQAIAGIPPDDFLTKQEGPEALLQAVEKVFREKVAINYALEIEWGHSVSLRQLVDEIKDFSQADEATKKAAEEELEELLRRLFFKESKIKVYYMTRGRGGSGVALVRPFYGQMEGALVVVKFGKRESIEREVANYGEYVEPFILKQATVMVGQPVQLHRLAGCKFLFVGLSPERLRDFNAFYREYQDDKVPPDRLYSVLENIFAESCKIWYVGKRDWADGDEDLISGFERQLSLDSPEQRQELRENLEALLDGKFFHRVAFSSKNEGIHVTLGKTEHLLPNPIRFLQEKPEFFPHPSFMCIVHGDLNGRNMFVDEAGRVWLIDFYKTGLGPIFADVAELESAIKFELLKAKNLWALYKFEKTLLKADQFTEDIQANFALPELNKAWAAIKKLRRIAFEIGESDDMREYYASLFFYALKMITWQGISSVEKARRPIRQRHALLSAAMICDKLLGSSQGKKGVVFLAHEYQEPWWGWIYGELKPFITGQGYEVRHPKDEAPGGVLWERIANMISGASLSLCEMTTMNGNVCFELGYAMGLRKPFFALINTDHIRRQEVPPVLQGEWWVVYLTDQELHEKVGRILSQQHHTEPWHFFEQETFKARLQTAKTRRGSALLAVANVPRQRQDIYPALEKALTETCGWRVEPLFLERQTDLGELCLQIIQHELIVGSLSSDEATSAPYANAELALALGMACGAKKKVIILQEQGCQVLADMRTLTRQFRGKNGAANVLREELKRMFPRRCKRGK